MGPQRSGSMPKAVHREGMGAMKQLSFGCLKNAINSASSEIANGSTLANSAPTRVLVCGGRDYANSDVVWRALDNLGVDGRKITVIEGGAEGTDYWARVWCYKRGMPIVTVCAEWEKYGRAACPIR